MKIGLVYHVKWFSGQKFEYPWRTWTSFRPGRAWKPGLFQSCSKGILNVQYHSAFKLASFLYQVINSNQSCQREKWPQGCRKGVPLLTTLLNLKASVKWPKRCATKFSFNSPFPWLFSSVQRWWMFPLLSSKSDWPQPWRQSRSASLCTNFSLTQKMGVPLLIALIIHKASEVWSGQKGVQPNLHSTHPFRDDSLQFNYGGCSHSCLPTPTGLDRFADMARPPFAQTSPWHKKDSLDLVDIQCVFSWAGKHLNDVVDLKS